MVNVSNDNEACVVPRGYVALLEHARTHACESHDDLQDCACHANRKDAQPIDSN